MSDDVAGNVKNLSNICLKQTKQILLSSKKQNSQSTGHNIRTLKQRFRFRNVK